MDELAAIDEDSTDSVRLTVTKHIQETVRVDFRSADRCKLGEKRDSTENLIESVVKIVIIDEDDFEIEDTSKPDAYRLEEIFYNIKSLDVREAKRNIAKALSLSNIDTEDLSDFNLGAIRTPRQEFSLSSFTDGIIHDTFERSVPLYYLAALLLEYVYEHSENPKTKALLKYQTEHLSNAINVLRNALEVHHWLVPDLEPTRKKFDEFEEKLSGLADEYMKDVPEHRFANSRREGSGSELLRQNKQLIINYEIVSEVECTMSDLRDVFGTMTAEKLDERRGEGNFGFYGEVNRSSNMWEFSGENESEIREHHA